MNQKKILVLGGVEDWLLVYVDKFPDTKPQTIFCNGFHETIGGTGFGKSINLARLGFDVTFHSPIGDDESGHKICDFLAKEVDFIFDIDPGGTRKQIHINNKDGERLSYFLRHGSLNPNIDLARIEKRIISSDIIVLNTINYTKSIIPIIKQHKKEIWCDIHDYHSSKTYFNDFLQEADYLQFSSYHIPNYRDFMQELICDGKKLVLCTRSHEGATALSANGAWVDLPIIEKYERKDANGAGDAFFAGVLFGLANDYPLSIAMRFGIIVSGLSVTTFEPIFDSLSASLVIDEYRQHYNEEPYRI